MVERSTSATFPGIAALGLVAVALSERRNRSNPRFRMCVVIAGGCAAVSIAPLLPFYRVLHAVIPLFQAVRVLAHLGQIVLLMVAIIAGFGVATLQETWQQRRWWPLVAALILVVVNGEALRAPVGYTWFDGVPAVYDVLEQEPGAVVVELPFPLPQQWFLNTSYMVNSTRHWRPLLNGYSGFRPPSYYRAYEMTRGFPSDASLIGLHELGVTHIVVHQKELNFGAPNARYDPFAGVRSLQLLARDGDILIYRLHQ